MIAATAYDDCEHARREAERRGDVRAAIRAERAMATWLRDVPALQGSIVPDGDGFVVVRAGRRLERARTLREAEHVALTWGLRSIDITACGVFLC